MAKVETNFLKSFEEFCYTDLVLTCRHLRMLIFWLKTLYGFPSHSRLKPESNNGLQDLVLFTSDFLSHYSLSGSVGSSPLTSSTFLKSTSTCVFLSYKCAPQGLLTFSEVF